MPTLPDKAPISLSLVRVTISSFELFCAFLAKNVNFSYS